MATTTDKPMTTSTTSSTSSTKEVPATSEYTPPLVTISREDEVALRTTVRTSDEAQQMFLRGTITEDELAKAVAMFGKPSNPSETVNRADDAFDTKLPKWVFQAPEGTGLTMEQRQAEVEATSPEPGPMTHEQIVALPPEEQAKVAAEQKEEAK